MSALRWSFLVLTVLFAVGCGDKKAKTAPISDKALADAAYPSLLAPSGLAQLKDGHFAVGNLDNQGTTSVTLLDQRGRGLIDDDKAEDVAVIIAENGGGTGTFLSLFVVLNRDGHAQVGPFIALGDRQVIHSVDVKNHQIVLKMLIHAAQDPSCCPTVETVRTYATKDGKLELIAKTDNVPN